MACPYFIPEGRCESDLWPHRSRLPLGNGYRGRCGAPSHMGVCPTHDELKNCNLGYAQACSRRPENATDAVRFRIERDESKRVIVQYACERNHLPVAVGTLIFNCEVQEFDSEAQPEVLRLARAYISSYLARVPRKGND